MKTISLFKDTLKKAEQGDAKAPFYLGLMYYLGRGVTHYIHPQKKAA